MITCGTQGAQTFYATSQYVRKMSPVFSSHVNYKCKKIWRQMSCGGEVSRAGLL